MYPNMVMRQLIVADACGLLFIATGLFCVREQGMGGANLMRQIKNAQYLLTIGRPSWLKVPYCSDICR